MVVQSLLERSVSQSVTWSSPVNWMVFYEKYRISLVNMSIRSGQHPGPINASTALRQSTDSGRSLDRQSDIVHFIKKSTVGTCPCTKSQKFIHRYMSMHKINIILHTDKGGDSVLHRLQYFDF